MIFLKLLGKLIKALSSNDSPAQLAWGFVIGSFLGLVPLNTLFTVSTIFVMLIINVNIAAGMLAFALYSFIAWMIDPLFHSVGYWALTSLSFLESFWTTLFNAPIAPLTRFNNTVVMGSLLITVVLIAPNYFLFKAFVVRYRESWNEKIKQWKITKMLLGSKLVKLFIKARSLGGR